jgi:hypothetical protein
MDSPEFEACRRALADGLRQVFPQIVLNEFGEETPNPGVKVDLVTDLGMANIHLWRNLSFDVDAIENQTGRLLLHKSIEDATANEVELTIAELLTALR